MDGHGTTRRRNIAENVNWPSRVHKRCRQTDGPAIAYSEREREFTFPKKSNKWQYLMNGLTNQHEQFGMVTHISPPNRTGS